MITTRSSYEDCVAEIDLALKDVLADQPDIEAGQDEIWADLAASILIDANRKVAEEVCRVGLGFTPSSLLQVWKQRDEAKAEASRVASRARAQRAREERAAAEAARDAAALQAVKDARCMSCFTVRTPAGNCNCV
jgi:hypothetical protein